VRTQRGIPIVTQAPTNPPSNDKTPSKAQPAAMSQEQHEPHHLSQVGRGRSRGLAVAASTPGRCSARALFLASLASSAFTKSATAAAAAGAAAAHHALPQPTHPRAHTTPPPPAGGEG